MKKTMVAASVFALFISGCSTIGLDSLGIDKGDMLEKAFAMYDSNADDKVDLSEIDAVSESQPADEALLAKAKSEGLDWSGYTKQLFAGQDGDADGFLSRSEFAGYLKALQ